MIWLCSEGLKFDVLSGFNSFHGTLRADEIFALCDWNAQSYNAMRDMASLADDVRQTIEYDRTRLVPGFHNESFTDQLLGHIGH